MAGLQNYRGLAEAFDAGQAVTSHFRKAPSQTTIAGWWFDLSMASGSPVPQYYAASPLESNALDGMRGVFRGTDVAPAQKFLTEAMLCSPSAGLVGQYKLLDYLLYYPFVDCDVTDLQEMVEVDPLTRYTDGEGVRVMMVCQAPNTIVGTFTFDYINQDGVQRTSPAQTVPNIAGNIGSIMTMAPATAAGNGPFLMLASGDTGVRSIVSVTFSTPSSGLGALVLVKPLADLVIREVNTPAEKSFVGMRSHGVKIEDGAYLNMIVQCASTVAAGTLTGRLNFVWN